MNLPYASDEDLTYISSLCKALLESSCIGSYLKNYETHLLDNKTLIFKNKSYDLNTRAHRVYIVQQCMKIKGVLSCLMYYSSNQGLVQTQLQIKTEYLAYYDNLALRDKYIHEPECHFHQAIYDDHVNVSYYTHWLVGYNVGYCRTAMVQEKQNTRELQGIQAMRLMSIMRMIYEIYADGHLGVSSQESRVKVVIQGEVYQHDIIIPRSVIVS